MEVVGDLSKSDLHQNNIRVRKITFIGRLDNGKRVKFLIESFLNLKSKENFHELQIIGNGALFILFFGSMLNGVIFGLLAFFTTKK